MNQQEQLKTLWNSVSNKFTRLDYLKLRSRYKQLLGKKATINEEQIIKFVDSVRKAKDIYESRLAKQFRFNWDESLPILKHKEDIINALKTNQVIVVSGDTGSGKTTQLPKICLEAGYGVNGQIGCTQPRRLAAVSVAQRVSEEMCEPLSSVVGYEVRFDKKITDQTQIKFMTDGILLAETNANRYLNQYEIIIIDEAHERTLNIDFLLGFLKTLTATRKDLKIIISSATLEVDKFVAFFDDAPLIQVEGRTFPIEDFYLDEYDENEDLDVLVEKGVEQISILDSQGDILVFLPGEKEIQDAEKKLKGKHFPNTVILPLFARLNMEEQQRIFQKIKQRKIILATNVAETSITVPGIAYVVDSGLARISRFSNHSPIQRLQIEWVSKASVKQRRGRCGRVSEGICFHLYTKKIFEDMSEYTDPEIRRTNLAGVVLQMKVLGLGELTDFPLIDKPARKMVEGGYRTLFEIGAIDKNREITPIGKQISVFPLDPHIARMIIEGSRQKCLKEILVITAFLSAQDPRERPKGDQANKAGVQNIWNHEKSDFMGILLFWHWMQELRQKEGSSNAFKRKTRDFFINFRKWQEILNVYRELKEIAFDEKLIQNQKDGVYDDIHKSLLTGLASNIAYRDENTYKGASNQEYFIFPGSVLFQQKPKWIVSYALVETTKLFARTVAEIKPEWIEEVSPHLCSSSYAEGYWDSHKGCAYAFETVRVFNIPIIAKRRVFYGRVDVKAARNIFILDGLMRNDIKCNLPFLKHNDSIIKKIKLDEIKVRKIGGLYFEQMLYQFYDEKLPAYICTTKEFIQWHNDFLKNGDSLFINREDVFIPQLEEIDFEAFPDSIEIQETKLDIYYNYKPSDDYDGATMICPLHFLGQIKQHHLDWAVTGLMKEKLSELFKTIPKSKRVLLQPSSQWISEFFDYSIDKNNSLVHNLIAYTFKNFEVKLETDDFRQKDISRYLNIRLKIVDYQNEEVKNGRVLEELQVGLKDKSDIEFDRITDISLPIESVADWSKHAFTERTEVKTKAGVFEGFPAIYDNHKGLEIKIFQSSYEARAYHEMGLVSLFAKENKDHMKWIYKDFPIEHNVLMHWTVLLKYKELLRDILIPNCIEECLLNGYDNVYDAKCFSARSKEILPNLYEVCEEVGIALSEVLPKLSIVHKIKSELASPAFKPSIKDIEIYLNLFFNEQVFRFFSSEFLRFVGKLFQGFETRLSRLKLDPMKDRKKMETLSIYHQRVEKILPYLLTKEYRPKFATHFLEDYFLLHTSIFSQEIKLYRKVSAKIIDDHFDQVEKWLTQVDKNFLK